jgi:hypothetical protein
MQERTAHKLEDSLPTNDSSLSSSRLDAPPAMVLLCLEDMEWVGPAEVGRADRVLDWLKARGVVAGDPEELLSQHRS